MEHNQEVEVRMPQKITISVLLSSIEPTGQRSTWTQWVTEENVPDHSEDTTLGSIELRRIIGRPGIKEKFSELGFGNVEV